MSRPDPRRPSFAAIALLVLAGCAAAPTPAQVEGQFRETFRNMPVDAIQPSEIAGLYEVYSGGKLFYFAPREKLLIFGELYSTQGTSLSQAKVDRYLSSRVLSVDASTGVTVGEGPAELVGFLDPNCGHCAQAHQWLEDRQFAGVRLRVLFLAMDPRSKDYARAQQFVCAPPELRREALRQVYAHEDPAPGQRLLSCDGAADQLARQAQVAKDLGITGTPTFVAQGQTVLGFDQGRLESLLLSTHQERSR